MRANEYLYLLGPWFLRSGEDFCSVRSDYTDGSWIERKTTFSVSGNKTSDTIRMFIPSESDKELEPWSKFHGKLPEGVAERTGIRKLNIDGMPTKLCLNFLGQFEQGLALALKPSEVSKLMGSVSGRNKVDLALKNSNACSRRFKQEKEILERDVEVSEKALEKMREKLPDEAPEIDDLVAAHDELEKMIFNSDLLEGMDGEIHLVKERMFVLDFLDKLHLEDLEDGITDLTWLIQTVKAVPEVPDVDLEQFDDACDPFDEDLFNSLQDMIEDVEQLKDQDYVIKNTKGAIEEVEDELETASVKMERWLHKNKYCPFSGEKLPKGCIKALKS